MQRPPLSNPFVIPRATPPTQPSRSPSTFPPPSSQPRNSHPHHHTHHPPPTHIERGSTAPPSSQPTPGLGAYPRRPDEGFSQASYHGAGVAPLGPPGDARIQEEGGKPMSAQELMMRNKGKAVVSTASDRILAAIKDLGGQVSSLEGQISSLESTITELKSDNNHLRDQLHELHLGQRSLATKEEVADEVANQISVTIPDAVQSYSDRTAAVIKQVPATVAEAVMLKMEEVLKQKEVSSRSNKEADDSAIQPLSNLLTHLITKLDAIEQIGDACRTLHNLPQAIEDISTCRHSLDRLIRLTEHSLLNPSPPVATTPSSDTQQRHVKALFALKNSLQELHFKLDRSSASQQSSQRDAAAQAAHTATQAGLYKIFEAIKHVFTLQTEAKGFLQSLVAERAEGSQGVWGGCGAGSSYPVSANEELSQLSQTQMITPLSRRPAAQPSSQTTSHHGALPFYHVNRMAPPTPGLTNRLTSARSTSTGTTGTTGSRGHPTSQPASQPTTSQGTSQGTSVGGGPLVGDSVADIFGMKRYIPGPVRVGAGVLGWEEGAGEGRSASPFPRNVPSSQAPHPAPAPAPSLAPDPSHSELAPLPAEADALLPAPPASEPPAPSKKSYKKKPNKKKPRITLGAATATATATASAPDRQSPDAEEPATNADAEKPKWRWPTWGTRPQTRLSSQAQSQSQSETEKDGGGRDKRRGTSCEAGDGGEEGQEEGTPPPIHVTRSKQRHTLTSAVARASATPLRSSGSPAPKSGSGSGSGSRGASMAERRAAVSAREFAKMEEGQQRAVRGRKRTWEFEDEDD
ncbi:hypothetical protein IAT38_008430 [Cryptococcus sp. DSM 104549]